MNTKLIIYFTILFSLLTGCASGAKHKNYDLPYNAYLDGKNSKVAVILCHGRGHHPTWDVVDPLRKGIHKELGFHTLSIQMPVGGDWREYIHYFDEAYQRIQISIDYLTKEKGVTHIYLMGHSMGARMASAFLVQDKRNQITGFIGAGVVGGGDGPLDANSNVISVSDRLPIIDVVANGDVKDRFDAEYRRNLISSKHYTQVTIDSADHRFSGYEDELLSSAVSWLRRQK